MEFKPKLQSGKLIKRYKRFLADIELDSGEIITAHCPNPGAMLGILSPGNLVRVSKSNSLTRKLPYTWQMVQAEGVWIGVNTHNPNVLVKEALLVGKIESFRGYKNIKAEVAYGANSRIDFLLTDGPTQSCFLEVKNVHLVRHKGLAEFPDCVTDRGAKHLAELGNMALNGHRCVLLYIVQREDVDSFQVAHDLDVVYGQASKKAQEVGVEFLAYSCNLSETSINISAAPIMVNS